MATTKAAPKADKKPKTPAAKTAATSTAPATTDKPADGDQAQAQPNGGTPPDAQQYTEQHPKPVDAQEAERKKGDTVQVHVEPIHRLERAQALTELEKSTDPAIKRELVPEGIQSFKDTDGRTMNVVVVNGALYKQEV